MKKPREQFSKIITDNTEYSSEGAYSISLACEQVAYQQAIEFAKWISKKDWFYTPNKVWVNNLVTNTGINDQELLEIFKKEHYGE